MIDKGRKTKLFLLIIILAHSITSFPQEIGLPEISILNNNRNDISQYCRKEPTKNFRVCNEQRVILKATEQQLSDIIDQIAQTTSSTCENSKTGFQAQFIIIKEIQPLEECNNFGPQYFMGAMDYSCILNKIGLQLYKKYRRNTSSKGCNSGLLFILEINHSLVQIIAGKNAIQWFPKSVVQKVYQRIAPFIKNKEYDNAALDAMIQVSDILHKPYGQWEKEVDNNDKNEKEEEEASYTLKRSLFWLCVLFCLFC